jgi:hypothetical protein
MSDRMRQWLVTAAAIFMIFGTLYGFGLIGTPVEQSSSGSLSAIAVAVVVVATAPVLLGRPARRRVTEHAYDH